MGVNADLVNAVRDRLKARMVSGQSLDYVKKLIFGGDSSTQLALPMLAVSLAPNPDTEEEYNGSGDFKNATLRVQVECLAEEKSGDYPYGKSGDATQRGILILTDDVKNALDEERDALLGANGKAYDMNCKASGYQVNGPGRWQALVVIEFKERFIHGGR